MIRLNEQDSSSMEKDESRRTLQWLLDLSNGVYRRGIDFEAMNGLGIVRADKESNSVVCSFVVPDRLSDEGGNWHMGAIATLIDSLGATVNYYATGIIKATVDLNVSFLSKARIREEVEVEAKLVGQNAKGKLSLVEVKVRKKGDGKVIALAKQWLGSINMTGGQFSKM